MRYVVLLRGINVGRAKQLPMADLRDLLTGLGHTDVRTLLRSGNAVVTAAKLAPATVERAIRERFGFDSKVLVFTRDEFAATIADNPLPVPDGAKFLVAFLDRDPDPAVISGLDPDGYTPERFAFAPRAVYLWCAGGIADSMLFNAVLNRLGVTNTARNWNTVTKLLALADA